MMRWRWRSGIDYLGINLDSIIALNVHKEESEKGSLDSQERNINIVEMVSNSTNPEDSQEDDHQIRAEDSNQPSSDVISTQSSQAKAIFISVGEKLRQQREKLGFSFDEVERHTHVKKHYLEALEAGELGNLPSPVQARGMLNNYAHFLNLNTDAFLALFADGLQAQHRENHPLPNSQIAKKGDTHTVSKILGSLISFDVIFGGSLIILLVVFAVWGTFIISRSAKA